MVDYNISSVPTKPGRSNLSSIRFRLTWFAVCLGLPCLMLTGNALAGTTTATEVTYAREVGTINALATIPGAVSMTRALAVLRTGGGPGNFFLRVGLGQNAEFDGTGLPAAGDLTQTGGLPAGNVVVAIPSAPADGDTFVDFLVSITADFMTAPTFTVDASGWVIQDVDNLLGGGGIISATLSTRDSSTGTPFDPGTDTVDWLKSTFGVDVVSALNPTTAEFDFTTFVDTPPDTTLGDNGATLGIDSSVPGPLTLGGAAYTLIAADTVELVVAGDLSGITAIIWDPAGVVIVDTVTTEEVSAGSTTLTIPGDSTSLDGSAIGLSIRVDGTTTLTERTLTITVNLVLSGGAGGPSANSRTLVSQTTLTTWSSSGIVDGVRPETTITDGPSGTISEINVTFTFTGSDNVTPVENLVYAFRLDPLEPNFSAFSSSTTSKLLGPCCWRLHLPRQVSGRGRKRGRYSCEPELHGRSGDTFGSQLYQW